MSESTSATIDASMGEPASAPATARLRGPWTVETLARNEAPSLGADTVQPKGQPVDGEQRFLAFSCGSASLGTRACARDNDWGSSVADVNLSDREIDILRCLIFGDANKVISRQLHISEATVKVHVKTILRKLRAAGRSRAMSSSVRTLIVSARVTFEFSSKVRAAARTGRSEL